MLRPLRRRHAAVRPLAGTALALLLLSPALAQEVDEDGMPIQRAAPPPPAYRPPPPPPPQNEPEPDRVEPMVGNADPEPAPEPMVGDAGQDGSDAPLVGDQPVEGSTAGNPAGGVGGQPGSDAAGAAGATDTDGALAADGNAAAGDYALGDASQGGLSALVLALIAAAIGAALLAAKLLMPWPRPRVRAECNAGPPSVAGGMITLLPPDLSIKAEMAFGAPTLGGAPTIEDLGDRNG